MKLGLMWDHDSSSTLEIAWNVLRSNGLTEKQAARLDLPCCNKKLAQMHFVHPAIPNRKGLSMAFWARCRARASFPRLLLAMKKQVLSGLLLSPSACPECAKLGLHSIGFGVPWVTHCAYHGCRLECFPDFSYRNLKANAGKRCEIASFLDVWANELIESLKFIPGNALPFLPMRKRRAELKSWHFRIVQKIREGGDAKEIPRNFDFPQLRVFRFDPSPRNFDRARQRRLLATRFHIVRQRFVDRLGRFMMRLPELVQLDVSSHEWHRQWTFGGFLESLSRLEPVFRHEQRHTRGYFPYRCKYDFGNPSTMTLNPSLAKGLTVLNLSESGLDFILETKLIQSLINYVLCQRLECRVTIGSVSGRDHFVQQCESHAISLLRVYRPYPVIFCPVVSLEEVFDQSFFEQYWTGVLSDRIEVCRRRGKYYHPLACSTAELRVLV